MKTRTIGRNILIMIVFGAYAVIQFSQNVKPVQILGIFACGVVFGAALIKIIITIRAKKEKEHQQ